MRRLILFAFLIASPLAAQEHGRGYKPLTPEKRAALHKEAFQRHRYRQHYSAMYATLPTTFDCRQMGWVLPIGDQGNCGSCYLYSTVYGTATSAAVKAGLGKADGSFILSVQYGMDCHDFGGCGGGNGTEVIDWMAKNGWVAEKYLDSSGKPAGDYAGYSARSQSCRKPANAKIFKPLDWGFCTADQSNRRPTTTEVKTAMFNYGPLNVSLDAGGQFSNGTGTITSLGGNIDHEIECVAWDDNKDGGAFLLKNQWGVSWGNGGYRWVTYKAFQNCVDVFWVSFAPLPPVPPDPPVPPPPPPPEPGATITLAVDLKAGTYQIVPLGSEVVPVGTMAKLRDIDAKVKELEALLKKADPPQPEEKKPAEKPAPPVKEEAKATAEPPLIETEPASLNAAKWNPYNQPNYQERYRRSFFAFKR